MDITLSAGPIERVLCAALALLRLACRALLAGFAALWRWQERAHERAKLAELDEYMLADMGITAHDVVRETERPFWMR